MASTSQLCMLSLEGSELRLAQPIDDLRGLTVVDLHLHRVGDVDGLILDEEHRRARFLVVGSGGILGLARTHRLVPVDAVTRVNDRVQIGASHEQVYRSPEYDPEATPSAVHGAVYDHYGYLPFWSPDYVNPSFLRRSDAERTPAPSGRASAAQPTTVGDHHLT